MSGNSQIKIITDENNWLREELVQTREKLEKLEMELIEKNSKIEHFEFLNSLGNSKRESLIENKNIDESSSEFVDFKRFSF